MTDILLLILVSGVILLAVAVDLGVLVGSQAKKVRLMGGSMTNDERATMRIACGSASRTSPDLQPSGGRAMLQMLPKTRDIEVLAKGLVLTLTPVPADDDRYSNEMCPQPLELICADFSFLRPPLKPKRKRCRVKKRPPVPRCVLPAMPRPRERRSAAPHVTGGGRDGSGERDGGGGDGDGGGSDPPPAPPALAYDIAGRTL